MSADVSYLLPIRTSGARYCLVWMSSLKWRCVQQAFPRSTITDRVFNSAFASFRSGGDARGADVPAEASLLADSDTSPDGFLPPSLKPASTPIFVFRGSRPSASPREFTVSDVGSIPEKLLTLSFIEFRAVHQLATSSKASPTKSNEADPSSPSVGLALKSFTRRRSNPSKHAATDDGSLEVALFALIAIGWLQIVDDLGPKTTLSRGGLPSSLLYARKTTPGKRLSRKLSTTYVA
mmetsp:Transcript_69546/g.104982  ORF Transcript_69546/g.104982 Transcript_69546/m.104982 type:complete len:236 (+) Transcript_69546:1809-2516(+)